jgi:hypothetical protein
MQALESLNDAQVNDFLSGKAPLNLSVRLGDHMMLIQLQLSTLSQSQQNTLKQKLANSSALKAATAASSGSGSGSVRRYASTSMEAMTPIKRLKQNVSEREYLKYEEPRETVESVDESATSAITEAPEQSPIKSLSNLVSGPIKTSVQNLKSKHLFQPIYRSPATPSTSTSIPETIDPCTDPISAKLTSCLCKRLNTSCNNNCETPGTSTEMESCCQEPTTSQRVFLERTPQTAISKPKYKPVVKRNPRVQDNQETTDPQTPLNTSADNPALAEASRNLTQTLRRLSKRVFTNKFNLSAEETARARPTSSQSSSVAATPTNAQSNSGAVIESMKHHGKGIYSGTFSGTLNPALQDKYGRPKRDISTIIHILNDLLSATPQVAKNSSAKIYLDPVGQVGNGATGSSAGSSSTTTAVPSITPSGKFVKVCLLIFVL